MGRFTRIVALCAAASLFSFGQSEDCSGEPSMVGGTLPINTLVTPMADDFAMTGLGCQTYNHPSCGFQDGYDMVACFTPSNDCEVVFQVATGSVETAIHVFAGDCMEPVECVASTNGDTLFSIFLDRGVQYCFVGERCGSINMNMFIGDVNGTDCGLFLNPNHPFPACTEALVSWNGDRVSPCTGLNRYTVLDLVALANGACPCNFPL